MTWRRRTRLALGALGAAALIAACASAPDGQATVDGAMRLARAEMSAGRHGTAKHALLEVRHTARDGDRAAEHALMLGDCRRALEEYDAALQEYYRCRAANDGDDAEIAFRSSWGLGLTYQGLGQWTAAERHLEECVRYAPEPIDRDRAVIKLAEGAVELGAHDRARGYLARVKDSTVYGFDEVTSSLQRRAVPARPEAARARPPARPGARRRAPVAALSPRILARREWRARAIDPAGDPSPMEPAYRITVHHAADSGRPPTHRGEAAARMRRYQALHQDDRGWADIGYHYVIDGAGRIWEGRELSWQGAHAGNEELNRGNIGVCLMGNFMRDEPTPSQKEALETLLTYLCKKHGIPARRVVGHGTIVRAIPGKSTACPGTKLTAYLMRLRHRLPQ